MSEIPPVYSARPEEPAALSLFDLARRIAATDASIRLWEDKLVSLRADLQKLNAEFEARIGGKVEKPCNTQ